jgi:AcrR family transcriptional regulator
MSLRKRKKRLAMRSVQRTALDLFEEYGFDEVSVEEISEVSEASPSTIYRHFGTKEQLVLWDESDAAIEQALRKYLGTVPPLAALRSAFVEAYSGLTDEELTLQRRRGALIDETPQVFAAMAGDFAKARIEIQGALRAVYKKKCNERQAEMTARVGLQALVAGFEAWQREGPKASLAKCIDQAFDALESIIG